MIYSNKIIKQIKRLNKYKLYQLLAKYKVEVTKIT